MKHGSAKTVAFVLGLTTLQVVWWWWADDRQFTRLSLAAWVCLLALLGSYCLLLRFDSLSGPFKRFHERLYAQITTSRIIALGCAFLGLYAVWYTQHVWGESLIRGDYGSIMYRTVLLHQIFPRLLAYNPMLNGGYVTYELLMTGSMNLFLLTYPIGLMFSPETAFKAQPLLLILLLPGLIYISGRIVEFSHPESLFSAAFALLMTVIGYGGFVHLLHVGILPYVFSCELALVVFALSYRVFVLGKSAMLGIPLIILLGSLASLHPVFFLIMGPLAFAIVAVGTIPWKRRLLYCALIGIGLMASNAVWVSELLTYNLGQDVAARLEPRSLSLKAGLVKLENSFFGLQAALLFAAFVGLRSLLRAREQPAKRRLGGLLLFAIVYYFLVSATGYYWMKQSLFPIRFVVPLSFFLALALAPALEVVRVLWTQMEKVGSLASVRLNAALAALAIFLCLPYLSYFMIFSTASQATYQLVNWLKDNGDDGRVFVYGPDMKEFGQISFYQVQSTRPLMGFFHGQNSGYSLPWLQAVGACLQNPETVSQCESQYNIRYAVSMRGEATVIDTDGPRQGVPFPDNGGPAGFRLIKTIDNVLIYENQRDSNYFLMGRGHVKQYSDRITVSTEGSESVVLKFFWFPGLRTEPPLVVEPYRMANGQAFIKIRTLHQQRFEIFYR